MLGLQPVGFALDGVPKYGDFVHHSAIPGNPVGLSLGIHMRKVALFAAFALSVAFLSTSSVPASAQDFCALNKNTCTFMMGLGGGPAPAAAPAAAPAKKAAKKGGKKKKA
jgi:hypothetical protein